MKNIIKYILVLMLFSVMLSACGKADEDEQVAEFEKDTIFCVGKERVSLSEWYLYALPMEADLESQYGAELWSYKVGDSDIAEAVKQDIMRSITYIKLVQSHADELGVSLSDDDMLDIDYYTEEYSEKLGTERMNRYGIDKQTIKRVYMENALAKRVYERLTLNVNTDIPEDDVRHMVLQYIMLPKYTDGEDESEIPLSEEECSLLREEAEEFLQSVRNQPDVVTLAQADSDTFVPLELVADRLTLEDKLPEGLGSFAYGMREGEISDVFETEKAFFILNCVQRTEEISTNEAKVRIIEAREADTFSKELEEWNKDIVLRINYTVWDTVKIGELSGK